VTIIIDCSTVHTDKTGENPVWILAFPYLFDVHATDAKAIIRLSLHG
jgi:hypothetical protein